MHFSVPFLLTDLILLSVAVFSQLDWQQVGLIHLILHLIILNGLVLCASLLCYLSYIAYNLFSGFSSRCYAGTMFEWIDLLWVEIGFCFCQGLLCFFAQFCFSDILKLSSVLLVWYPETEIYIWANCRVTCRDWFQLSLKEGLTVFRDQVVPYATLIS